MNVFVAVALVLALGGLLILGSSRATANVENGRLFLRWMLVVFGTYLAMISLPAVVGF